MRTNQPTGIATTIPFTDIRAYLLATAFIIGNLLLPQLCHLIPQGGLIFLPIYFFTLIAAYRYGWQVGILTAVGSPIINSLLFGMPPASALPAILLKSVALALAAAYISRKRGGTVTLAALALVILLYQGVGMIAEFLAYDLQHALQDVRLGYPGLIVQLFGGYLLLKWLQK